MLIEHGKTVDVPACACKVHLVWQSFLCYVPVWELCQQARPVCIRFIPKHMFMQNILQHMWEGGCRMSFYCLIVMMWVLLTAEAVSRFWEFFTSFKNSWITHKIENCHVISLLLSKTVLTLEVCISQCMFNGPTRPDHCMAWLPYNSCLNSQTVHDAVR